MAMNLEAVLRLRDEFTSQMGKAKSAAGKFEGKMGGLEKAQKKLSDGGKAMSKKVTAPLVGAAGAAVYTASNFEDSMARVQAVSGASSDELARMEGAAREAGATTAHSASAAASALEYTSLAGWDAAESVEALPGVLDLASAGSVEMSSAADILTDTMSAFGMGAEDAGKASDIFAKAQASANTDVNQLGQAMSYLAPIANAAGMDLEEAATSVGILSDSGLKGSKAGTSMVAVLSDLQNAAENGKIAIGDYAFSIFDAEGEMKSFPNILAGIKEGMDGLSGADRADAMQDIFGRQAMKGMEVFLQDGREGFMELEDTIRDSTGAAAEQAEIMEDTFGGSMREMRSAIEDFLIEVGDALIPALEGGVEIISDLARKFGDLSGDQQRAALAAGALAAAIGPAMLALSMMVSVGRNLATVFRLMAKAKLLFSKTLLLSPLGWIVAAIAAVVAAGVLLYRNWDLVTAKASELWAALVEAFASIRDSVTDSVSALRTAVIERFEAIREGIASAIERAREIVVYIFTQLPADAAYWLGYMVGRVVALLAELPGIFRDYISQAYDNTVEWLGKLPGRTAEFLGDMKDRGVTILTDFAGDFKEWFQNAYDNAADIIRDLPQTIADFIGEIPGKVRSMISSVQDSFAELGSSIVDGIVGGFESAMGALGGAAKWAVDTVSSGMGSLRSLGGRAASGLVDGVTGRGSGHFHGLDSVPYDGYHARLHRGEAVLDRNDAEAWRNGQSGGGGGVNVTVQNMTVRNDSDIDKIAAQLYSRIEKAQVSGA
ncbi:phage tail tape measure protein [Alkalicoccus chagannorensis]|uniref:phage tail tape measure protein n=1 Tax=Alkalicoccus chagannorensis TaxID=427072 RepID=UPI0006856D81|nr:phage tail tape measure protein [Alkalicoccus chagannorensis]